MKLQPKTTVAHRFAAFLVRADYAGGSPGLVAATAERSHRVRSCSGRIRNDAIPPRPNRCLSYARRQHLIKRTIRRADFIGDVKDGPTNVYDIEGRILEINHYRNGRLLSNEHWFRDQTGRVVLHGEMIDGHPHGLWQWFATPKQGGDVQQGPRQKRPRQHGFGP